jgi:hypothetical protein
LKTIFGKIFQVKKYQLIDHIGIGSFGHVFSAIDVDEHNKEHHNHKYYIYHTSQNDFDFIFLI